MNLSDQAASLCDGLTVDQQVDLLNSLRGVEAAAWVFALSVFGLLMFFLVRAALQTRPLDAANMPLSKQDATPTQTMQENEPA